MKKFPSWLMGCRKCYFLNFAFTFLQISNEFCQNLIMEFEGSYETQLLHKHFWSTHIWQWNGGPIQCFWNLHGNAFSFSIFPERKILLLIDDTILHYAYLNSSSINEPFLSYGRWIYYFVFFDFLFMSILTRIFSKTLGKNIIF